MSLTQLSVRGGNQPVPVDVDEDRTAVFKNNGPDTVYYGDTRSVTSATGTAITEGSSVSLSGATYLVVANTLGALAKVAVTISDSDPGGSGSTLTAADIHDMGFATIEDAPQIVTTDPNSHSADAWFGAVPVARPCIVRAASLLLTASLSGTSGSYWTLSVAVSRKTDDNPITITGGTTNLVVISSRSNIGGDDGITAATPWFWDPVTWDDEAAVLLPGDVLGIYYKKTGTPSAFASANRYSFVFDPVGVS